MAVPDILDIQLIVASYVSDNIIDLINLSHLWEIAGLDKLYNGIMNYIDCMPECDSKLHQYMELAVDVEDEISYVPKNMKSMYINSEDIKKTIEFLDTFPADKPSIHIKSDNIGNIGNLFKKHKIYETSIVGTFNSEYDFLKDIISEKISLVAQFTNRVKLSIHESVLVFNIGIRSDLLPEIVIPDDSMLEQLHTSMHGENIQNILRHHPFKKLKELELTRVENLEFLKNPYLKNLSYLYINVTDNQDVILYEVVNGKIIFPLQNLDLSELNICTEEHVKIQFFGKLVLSNPKTLKCLSLNFPTELFDFCSADEFGDLKSIFHDYTKLESFGFTYSKTMYFVEDLKNIINFLPSVDNLTIKISTLENVINQIIYIPKSVHTLILNFGRGNDDIADFLAKLRFENILNIRKLTIVSENAKFIYLLQHGAGVFSEMKKLETIQLQCGFLCNDLSLSLPNLLEQLPDSLINMELMCVKIDSDLKYIDFRKFRKLQYLNISIMCKNNYSDPIIYLPTSANSGFLQVEIVKRFYDGMRTSSSFKNIIGLYI